MAIDWLQVSDIFSIVVLNLDTLEDIKNLMLSNKNIYQGIKRSPKQLMFHRKRIRLQGLLQDKVRELTLRSSLSKEKQISRQHLFTPSGYLVKDEQNQGLVYFLTGATGCLVIERQWNNQLTRLGDFVDWVSFDDDYENVTISFNNPEESLVFFSKSKVVKGKRYKIMKEKNMYFPVLLIAFHRLEVKSSSSLSPSGQCGFINIWIRSDLLLCNEFDMHFKYSENVIAYHTGHVCLLE
jgi:hypothetical protein